MFGLVFNFLDKSQMVVLQQYVMVTLGFIFLFSNARYTGTMIQIILFYFCWQKKKKKKLQCFSKKTRDLRIFEKISCHCVVLTQ